MKKLILVLVFAVAAFAQRGPGPQGHSAPAPQHGAPQQQQHYNAPLPQQPQFHGPAMNGWNRFGQPGIQPMRPPQHPPFRPPIIIQRPIVVRPYYNYGYYPWSTYYDWGYWPYYPMFFDNGVMTYRQPQPCKKETLKDANKVKHQILICVQSDGTTQVIDANTMTAAPK